MPYCRLLVLVLFLVQFCPAILVQAEPNSSLPRVAANGNRTPSGQLKDRILNLRLELREGRWYPEEDSGGYRDVYAFGEEGRATQSPGPLIRVPQGTEIRASIRNMLPFAAKIYGLHRHPGASKEVLKLAPGEIRELQFMVGEPGTYLYWATTSDKPLRFRDEAETILSGAFIVDPPGANSDDRIFVIGIWTKGVGILGADEEIPFINGKSWPYSEHLTYKLGEAIHWRVINPTFSNHAMHLHGFYYLVDGSGDGERYQRYSAEQKRKVVTERIEVGHVFEMTWTPERPGNWLFHCHMVSHMSPPETLHPPEAKSAANSLVHDHSAGMGGLVIGVTVPPSAGSADVSTPTTTPHKLQLVISDNPGKIPLYQLEINDAAAPASANAKKPSSLLGPPIVLTRGEATEIEVKNQIDSPTAIHWHGIELESYYDGVAGWAGSLQRATPPVGPGTSFVARMTPPHAGTFIYHTHWHDQTQLANGIYGPLIVLEAGQKYDPDHDKTFVFSDGEYVPFRRILLVNGSPEPYPLKLVAGTRYRLRLINISGDEVDMRVRLVKQDALVQWRVTAKDGADIPAALSKFSAADMTIAVGETYDVEYQADNAGDAELQIWLPDFPVRVTQPLMFLPLK